MTTNKPKKKRFRDVRSVKQELGNLYNMMKAGEIDMLSGVKLATVLKILLDACDKIVSFENVEQLRELIHKKKYGDKDES